MMHLLVVESLNNILSILFFTENHLRNDRWSGSKDSAALHLASTGYHRRLDIGCCCPRSKIGAKDHIWACGSSYTDLLTCTASSNFTGKPRPRCS